MDKEKLQSEAEEEVVKVKLESKRKKSQRQASTRPPDKGGGRIMNSV